MVTSIIREIIYKARSLTENENKINGKHAVATVTVRRQLLLRVVFLFFILPSRENDRADDIRNVCSSRTSSVDAAKTNGYEMRPNASSQTILFREIPSRTRER